MEKIRKIYLVCAYTLIVAFIVCFFCFPDFQANVFLGKGGDFMGDFFNPVFYSQTLNPYRYGIDNNACGDIVYAPIIYLFFFYFGKISPCGGVFYTIKTYPQFGLVLGTFFSALSTFCLFYLLSKVSDFRHKFWIMLSLIFSGLYLFTFERGNVITLCVIFFTIFLFKDKLRISDNIAAFSLALASVFKLTPVMFSLLYLYKKDYKNFFKFLLFFALLFFVPFLFIKGQFSNVFLLLQNLAETKISYTYINLIQTQLPLKYSIIFGFIAALTAGVSIVFNHKFKNRFETVTGLVLSLYFLFLNNALYVLLLLFPCFILFMNKTDYKKIDYLYLICFIVIFNPLQIVIHDLCINTALIKIFAFIFLSALTSQNLINICQNKKNIKNKS